MCGDVNFHLENENEENTICFQNLCTLHGLYQHVDVPTLSAGSTLDVILTKVPSASIVSYFNVLDCFLL